MDERSLWGQITFALYSKKKPLPPIWLEGPGRGGAVLIKRWRFGWGWGALFCSGRGGGNCDRDWIGENLLL